MSNLKLKLSLVLNCVMKHYAMKSYGGMVL
jgi:hypothetical protein